MGSEPATRLDGSDFAQPASPREAAVGPSGLPPLAPQPASGEFAAAVRPPAYGGGLDAHRVLDLVLAILLLPLLALVGVLVAIVVFLDSPGPIFYRAPRVGRDGRVFAMWKFRKMHRDARGPALTSDDDERFTPVGRFLTASRLDELPQVWNVLKGDMRLVGPRPEVSDFVEHHPEEYAEILGVTPGLTGLAQLEHVTEGRLLRDCDDPLMRYKEEIMPRKLELDLLYVRGRSVGGDLLILARTLLLPLFALRRRVVRAALAAHRAGATPIGAGAALLLVLFVVQAGPLR